MLAVTVTAGVRVDGVTDAVVVVVAAAAGSLRSFFRKRSRDVSSGSTAFAVGTGAVFFVTFVAGSTGAAGGDLVSLGSGDFLVDGLFGDTDEFRLLAIIDGFSKMFGTICGELPNFELFSARGLLKELNERNSVLSVLSFVVGHVGTSRRPDGNELVNRLFSPLDFGDNGSLLILLVLPVSDLIWKVDANDFVSPFLMFDGKRV